MRIVVDANIVIAALLGSGSAVSIITNPRHQLYAPHSIIDEVHKYKKYVCEKKGKAMTQIDETFTALLEFIQTVEHDTYAEELSKAASAIGWRDANDVAYVACALAIQADCVLTEDKDFVTQKLVPVKTILQFIHENRNI